MAAGVGRLHVAFATARDERGAALARALIELRPDAEVTWVAAGGPFAADVVVVPELADDAIVNPRPELLEALRAFAAGGGAVLGLEAGAALLCAAELLPGGVVVGGPPPTTHVRVEGRATPFTWAIPAGRILPLGDGPRPGSVYALSDGALARLEAAGRVVLRYCDHAGGVARTRAAGVAGLCDDAGRVVAVLAPLTTAQGGPLARQILACLRGR